MGQSRPLFVYFHSFLITISKIHIEKSVDGVLGIRTCGCRMEGAYVTTELWRPPAEQNLTLFSASFIAQIKYLKKGKLLTLHVRIR